MLEMNHIEYLKKERERYQRRKQDPDFRKRMNESSRKSIRKKLSTVEGHEYIKKRDRDYIQRIKLKVFNHYSRGLNKCLCCGISGLKFLSIDHLENNGNKHRKQIGRHIYLWLYSNKFPKGYQVLCYNCNHAKHLNGGICPHVA